MKLKELNEAIAMSVCSGDVKQQMTLDRTDHFKVVNIIQLVAYCPH
jgi:hypothetical protein